MAASRPGRGWLFYAGALTAVIVIGEISNLVRGEPLTWLLVADWIVTAALLTGAWGYVLQRPIADPRYWRRVFWIIVLASALMLLRVALAGTYALVVTVLYLLVLLPAYLALYRYAFRCAHLWSGSLS